MAATADIVFVIDESGSTAPFDTAFPGKHGESVQFWLHDMMPKLEEKLVGRGITNNRYAVVGFGGPNGQAPSRAFTFGPSEYFGTVDDAIGAISGFHNAGGNEDGWAGLARAVSLRDANITFRPEAAVQFVMVSDEFRGENSDGSATLIAEETLFELASHLHADNLESGAVSVLEDAVLTLVGNVDLELVVDDWPELGDDRIIGIDVHVLDNVNVDKNSDDPNNDVLPGQFDDDLTFFRIEDGTDRLYADQYIEPNAERFLDLDDPSGYQEWRTDLDDYSYTYIPLTTGSASYSMLAWESRGTVWDFNYFNDLFDHTSINGCNPAQSNPSCAPWINKAQVDVFTDAFIDDLFEKFRLQIIDFDGSGHIDLADDLPAFFDAAVSFIDPNIPNADERVFDLNNNGVFVSGAQTASPQIDPADIERMIVLFGTQFGDSNLDFQYSTSDFIAVFSVGEFEDTNELNSTWIDGDWSGDFEFDSSDFVVVFTADTFEYGYADIDGDGRYDFLPIWVDQNTIDPLTFDGLVSWYQPNWADPTV